MALAFFLLSCGGGWNDLEDCANQRKSNQKDECYAELLPELFRSDPEKADGIAQREVSDTQVRDFIYLAVTRKVDPSTLRWCDRIQESVLAERCRVLVNRPHLHRDLLGGAMPGAREVSGAAPPQPQWGGERSTPGSLRPLPGSPVPTDEQEPVTQ